jgi:hypothetical protein
MIDECRTLGLERVLDHAINEEEPRGIWDKLQEGDLVLLRRFEIDRHKGRKLEAQWEGPYRLTDLSWHGRSGRLQDLNSGEIVRVRKGGLKERCHVNDMKLFLPRGKEDMDYGGTRKPGKGDINEGELEANDNLVDLMDHGFLRDAIAVKEFCDFLLLYGTFN